jgi:hypothetical protein
VVHLMPAVFRDLVVEPIIGLYKHHYILDGRKHVTTAMHIELESHKVISSSSPRHETS